MIKCEIGDGLCQLWLARADKANALTEGMLEAIEKAATDAAQQGARALILTGEGKVFSAGADLEGMKAGLGTSSAWGRAADALTAFPGPTIAALNGTLAGGAFGMALACDLRIAVETARFFYPVMKLGFLPQPSDPARLVRLVGPSRAKMILMAGQRVEASEALAWGLIDRIVPADTLLDVARSLAADSLGAAASHVGAIKRLIG